MSTATRRPFKMHYVKSEASSNTHITIQKAPEDANTVNGGTEDYVVHHSEQDNIDLDAIIPTNTILPPPSTFAEAVMPPGRRSRGPSRKRIKSPEDGAPEVSLTSRMTLESVATVKYTAIRPKKIHKDQGPAPKLPPFDYVSAGATAADSASEMGSISDWYSLPTSPSQSQIIPRQRLNQPHQHTEHSSPTQLPLHLPSDFPSFDGDNLNFPTSAYASSSPQGVRLSSPLISGLRAFRAASQIDDSFAGLGLSAEADHNANANTEHSRGQSKNYEDVKPTPTQATFDHEAVTSHEGIDPALHTIHTAKRMLDELSETVSTKDTEEDAMAEITRVFSTWSTFDARSNLFEAVETSGIVSKTLGLDGNTFNNMDSDASMVKLGEDAFDSLDWDPDLASAIAPDESPKPIAVAPKPVAYTTVGSLVNPDAITQIAAPNRIQREGANRRPFMSAPQGRHYHDSYYQPRGQAPPLRMANSMQYAQQFSQSPHRLPYNQTPPSNSRRPSHTGRSAQRTNESDINLLSRLQGTAQQYRQSHNQETQDSAVGQSMAAGMFSGDQGISNEHNKQPNTSQLGQWTEQQLKDELQRVQSSASSQPSRGNQLQSHPSLGEHEAFGMGGLQGTSAHNADPRRHIPKLPDLTEDELAVLAGNLGPTPNMLSGNIMSQQQIPEVPSLITHSSVGNAAQDPRMFNVNEFVAESLVSRTHSVQGLEKMQTLQRLAKFENPMQNLARSRLQEFSVSKCTNSSPITTASAIEKLLRNKEADSKVTSARLGSNMTYVGTGDHPSGTLDQSYQFPRQQRAGTSNPQSNPLFRASQETATRPPGYPQPLTAGPPGQRQSTFGLPTNRSIPNAGHNYWQNYGFESAPLAPQQTGPSSSNWNITDCNPNGNPESPWFQQYTQYLEGLHAVTGPRPVPHDEHRLLDHSIQDTLPSSDILRYYPYGLPRDLNPAPRLISAQWQNDLVETWDEKKTRQRREDDDHHYSGQRLLGMTMHAHDLALEAKKLHFRDPHGPIAPLAPIHSIKALPKISPERIMEMSVGEAVAPYLEMMYNTFLCYAKDDTETSRRKLSKWAKSSADHIDDTPGGNHSFFGEDWGNPKYFVRNSRNGFDRGGRQTK